MLLLRDAQKADLKALRSLAAELNSVNLPNDERALADIIERSRASFGGRIRDPLARSYVFVLEEPRSGRLLGTSMVIAQHGTRESPCTFFVVSVREHYSSTLDRHFKHQVLSIGYHFDGPTEIGGLVVHPEDRGGEDRPGKQLAYVRFLYLAMHRERFRDRVLAELMPPLMADGRSLFWEACGKRFTGLEYQEADKRSRQNKEFIQQLFPPGDLYATLFPPRVQRMLGSVGPETLGVKHLLERIGFQFVGRIDPFDGGPHYEAKVSDVTLVRAHRRVRVSERTLAPREHEPEKLVGVERPDGRVRFRAVRTQARIDGDDVLLGEEAKELLEVERGERVHVIPFE
ncbi:MAG TPA: arginine N-succinyltransferase [Anaeromyxobacteraceae bacterium]|nr:arginine N-succinyltransferase [Anaeromyxobacteraceae bacterium]